MRGILFWETVKGLLLPEIVNSFKTELPLNGL